MTTHKRYDVIYADPAWPYNVSDPSAKSQHPNARGSSSNHYKITGLRDIQSMPVGRISNPDSVLFLWVLSGFLKQGIETLEAWGFKYVTVGFVWAKTTPRGNLGNSISSITMPGAELCLYGTRGRSSQVIQQWTGTKQVCEAADIREFDSPTELSDAAVRMLVSGNGSGYIAAFDALTDRLKSVIDANHLICLSLDAYARLTPEELCYALRREHSRKPEEIRRRIEALTPGRSRLEMFARERFPGWDAHGNELTDAEVVFAE